MLMPMPMQPNNGTLYALLMRAYVPADGCRPMLMYKRKVWEFDGPCFRARITYYPDANDLVIALTPYVRPD
jgi:hypothetical protein